MKALVTGATGFLGTHIVDKLLKKECEVIGLDLEDFYFNGHLRDKITIHRLDVREILSKAALFKGVDVVIHCATALHDSPASLIRSVNLDGTRAALDMCLKNRIPKFIFCSSTVVYGYFEYRPPVTEETQMAPVHPYAVSKAEGEEIVRGYRGRGVNCCIVRPKSFIGAGRFGIFQMLCDWIRLGAPIPIIGNGRNRYQLLGVSDLAEGFYRVAAFPVENETLNLGAVRFRSVREDLGDLISHAGSGSRLIFLPAAPAKFLLSALQKLGLTQMWEWHYKTADRNCYVDTSKAQRLIGWSPAQSNTDALIETYDWYVANFEKFRTRTGTGHHGVLWKERTLRLLGNVLALPRR